MPFSKKAAMAIVQQIKKKSQRSENPGRIPRTATIKAVILKTMLSCLMRFFEVMMSCPKCVFKIQAVNRAN